jgi:hypothetical protein
MRCYTGGETVFNNHQMCNVTSACLIFFAEQQIFRRRADRKIIDQVGADRAVQVTFSCDRTDETCSFQFWVAEVESFYCALDQCQSSSTPEYNTNVTTYACEHIKCSCIPGRFICGEDGSVSKLLSPYLLSLQLLTMCARH